MMHGFSGNSAFDKPEKSSEPLIQRFGQWVEFLLYVRIAVQGNAP